MITSAYLRKSSTRKVSLLLNPSITTDFFPFFLSSFTASRRGGMPIPPPKRRTNSPVLSTGKPFPRLPTTSMLSTFGKSFAKALVPSPTTLYTNLSLPFSLSISQILMGRGKSLEPSFTYSDTNCPVCASFAILPTSIHIENTSSESLVFSSILALILDFNSIKFLLRI